MKITFSKHLHLDDFTRTSIKERFGTLLASVSGSNAEFQLDGYVLSPNLIFDEDKGETVISGYTLMTGSEWPWIATNLFATWPLRSSRPRSAST